MMMHQEPTPLWCDETAVASSAALLFAMNDGVYN